MYDMCYKHTAVLVKLTRSAVENVDRVSCLAGAKAGRVKMSIKNGLKSWEMLKSDMLSSEMLKKFF